MARLSYEKVIQSVAMLSGLTKKECRAVIDDYMYIIRTSILNGMEIEIKNVGYFGLKYRPPKESRLMPDITKGGKMSWSSPKEEYNYPIFTMYKSFVKKVREVTEGHAFKTKRKRGINEATMSPEEYDEFSKRLDNMNFDSVDFDDDDYDGQANIERDAIYERIR
jgi:nucleoid DNA-binding protein